VSYVIENRFFRTTDGTTYTQDVGAYPAWRIALEVFDEVWIHARTEEVKVAPEGLVQVTGPGLKVVPVPNVRGLAGFLQARNRLREALQEAEASPALIIRGPSSLALVGYSGGLPRRPFGLEVVGDPMESTSFSSLPAKSLVAQAASRHLKKLARRAWATSYVTQTALQLKYPPGAPERTFTYSSVGLEADHYGFAKTEFSRAPLRIGLIGSLEQPYKGVDVLMRALSLLPGEYSLNIVGAGRMQAEYQRQAEALPSRIQTTFHGRLNRGQPIRDFLDTLDLYAQPSLTEGLPRALLEAMARGLPCIGSCVGGIPELIPARAMAQPGNAESLAKTIAEAVRTDDSLSALARECLETARAYHIEAMDAQHRAFLESLRL